MSDAVEQKPLVWIIDSSRAPLAGSTRVFEPFADARYFAAGEPFPLAEGRPDAVVFSAEIEGGPGGAEFRRLAADLAGTPLFAAARVRSLTQAVAYFRCGAADYLSLPLDPDETAERLAAVLTAGAAAPAVVLQLEALDGDAADVVLTIGGADGVDAESPQEDILAGLNGAGEPPAEPARDALPPEGDDEPVAVDGLPIPSLWEELPCGLLAFDSAGNLVFSNSLGLELFGFATLAELQDALDNRRASFAALGMNKKPFPDNQWPHAAAVKARAARHAVVSLERPDKTRVWLRMDCLPHLTDGEISRIAMTIVNMTGEIPSPAVATRPAYGRKRG